jgi:hypothetical protein|tara:strand:+ start:288 stop:452 length:165 start_codon:yes stop_codon:yes gene_type:complete
MNTATDIMLSMYKTWIEQVRQTIAQQGRIVDARLLDKERNLEQVIKELEGQNES